MPPTHPRHPDRGPTRGRILALLQRGTSTALELAQALDLTGNAVRAQLAALERDGLVIQHEPRRGKRKPALVFGLAREAEDTVSRAYLPLLTQLLRVLAERHSRRELDAIMQAVGKSLAAGRSIRDGTQRERAAAAAAVLQDLGAQATVAGTGASLRIEGQGCPLAAVVDERPEACRAVESLLSTLLGQPVREDCVRAAGGRPKCRFVLGTLTP